MATTIVERIIEVEGISVFVRERPGPGTPAVFVHGNPTSSADWIPFLEASRGPAIAFDLPGFGRSSRPDPARFDHSLGAYAELVEDILDQVAPERHSLVVHDWGGLALAAVQRRPERLERLVVINAVPLNDAYRWHWLGRIWRCRGLGEAFNALNTRFATERLLRLARPGRRPMPPAMVDAIWAAWDRGMSRAILGLYRSADPGALAAAGARLGELGCPALVLWGRRDPYIGSEQGRWYARTLPNADLIEVDAGHWPWIDRPELIERILAFLGD